MEMSKIKMAGLVLTVCLVASLSFNVYQFLNCDGETSMTKTFTRQHKNYIRLDGIVQINATFDWSGSNLAMTIKVKDNDSIADYIGLVFDTSKDGNLFNDYAYLLGSYNDTPPRPETNHLEDWGGIGTSAVILHPLPSPWHTCTFTEGEGYTFNIEIPKDRMHFDTRMLTHVCFWDSDAYWAASVKGGFPLQVAKEKGIVWFEFEVYETWQKK